MNDPEVTMHDALPTPQPGLDAHALAVAAAGTVLSLVAAVPPSMRFLADQARRAACSVPLNLAEGQGRFGRDRVYHFRIAYGSAKEAGSALEILAAGSLVDRDAAAHVAELLDRVRAMTWRLIHPRRWPGPEPLAATETAPGSWCSEHLPATNRGPGRTPGPSISSGASSLLVTHSAIGCNVIGSRSGTL